MPAPTAALDIDARPRIDRRTRRKSTTRAALVAAAVELFATVGFDEVTTTDIADAADVSQRTFFRHFPTKEAVLYGDMDEQLDELRAALHGRPDDESPLAAVRGALADLRPTFERMEELNLLRARLAAAYPSVSAYFRSTVQLQWEREIIVALAERMDVDPLVDVRPELLAGVTMSAIRAATRQWSMDHGRSDYVDLLDSALAVVPDLAD